MRDNEREVRPEPLRTIRAVDCIKAFNKDVDERANRGAIKTGFDVLDSHLGGGLYGGLYCIGAVSSAGKTTFVLQIADYISGQGTDVLIFSLEMSSFELMAKSISRNTCLLSMGKDGRPNYNLAKSTLDILDGSRKNGFTKEQTNVITSAINEYEKFQNNIYICEGVGDISVNTIKNEVKAHRDRTGRTPVVIVDYLQILSPHNEKATDKQNMDKSIVELKRLGRKTPVIAISSLNRTSYNGVKKQITEEASKLDAEMTAFKESGGIEYSCDVLMMLKTSNKKKPVRDISLVILKNRNGTVPEDELSYKYFAAYNYFSENVNIRF